MVAPIYLLLENRITDFKKQYGNAFSPSDINYIISNDPSGNQKYLHWIGKILTSGDDDDRVSPEEIMSDIALFHKNIKGVDLYSLKSFDQLQSLVHKKTEPTSRQKILNDTDIIVNNKDWLVVAPKTHDASMFFGGSTKWCISTSSETHWNKHYNEDGEAIIMIKNKKKSHGYPDWKLCITVSPHDSGLDYAYMYDANDNGSKLSNSSFYSQIPEDVVEVINDYLNDNHDGQSRMKNYVEEKESREIEEYMKADAIRDVLRDYIRFMREKFPRYTAKFDSDDLKNFLVKFVGEDIMNSMCRHIAQSAISDQGFKNLYIRNLDRFNGYLNTDSPENANFFNYGLTSYLNEVMGVEFLLNIVENNIGTANFDRIDSNYELTEALTDCAEKYARTINQANQLNLPSFPQTNEKFKTYDVNDIINLLHKYGYDNMANLIKSYMTHNLKEIGYKAFYKQLIDESFDGVFNFLLNPEHDNIEWYDLIRKFEASGGKVLGSGKYATVMEHPSWKYVLKVFSQDDSYLKYVRFVLKNKRPSFPVFYDKPRRIVPRFKRFAAQTYLYIVKTEKLYPIDKDMFGKIEKYLYYNIEFIEDMIQRHDWDKVHKNSWVEMKNEREELELKYPSLPQFKKDYSYLQNSAAENNFGSFDMTHNNVMKRANGEFVLSDPFWEGMSLHQIQRHAIEYETDYPSYEPDKPMLTGGELPKRKKINKPKRPIFTDFSPF